jgi:hypothetical protein
MTDLGSFKMKGHSFAMERMLAKDEEDRLDKVNTKQRRGTPTVTRTTFRKARSCPEGRWSGILLNGPILLGPIF